MKTRTEIFISDGTIEYLSPGIKRPVQNAYQNKTLTGNLLKAGRPAKRTRANVRIPVLSRILDEDGNNCRLGMEFIDPVDKGFKVIRVQYGLGLVKITYVS